MRENWHLSISGEKIDIVPYRRKFVRNYSKWMQDQYVLEMTASERLTLEEEYAMQQSWRDDPNKCTFIILSRLDGKLEMPDEERMVGDVNLFINDVDDRQNAEIDVMVPEISNRRKGYAREAIALMINFGVETLGLKRFFAKINGENAASLRLFKSLGFEEAKFVEVFNEFELRISIESEAGSSLLALATHGTLKAYTEEEVEE